MVHSRMHRVEGWRCNEMIVVTGSVGVNSPLRACRHCTMCGTEDRTYIYFQEKCTISISECQYPSHPLMIIPFLYINTKVESNPFILNELFQIQRLSHCPIYPELGALGGGVRDDFVFCGCASCDVALLIMKSAAFE
jgi:hypothetical protein